MNKNNFQNTYNKIIQQAQWRDSLGGKLVTGIGSLFKGGTKLISKGVTTGAKKIETGVKNAWTAHKVNNDFKSVISSLKSIYDNSSSVNDLINHKGEIEYIINNVGTIFKPQLVQFLNIFKENGKNLAGYLKSDPSSSSKTQQELIALIKQPLKQKLTIFKQQMQSKKTIATEDIFQHVFTSIILESTEDELINEAVLKGFKVKDSGSPNILSKDIIIGDISNFQRLLSPEMLPYKDRILNDKISFTLEIRGNNFISTLNSEFLKIEKTMGAETCNDIADFDNTINKIILDYYLAQIKEQERTNNLNSALSKAKYFKYSTALEAATNVIENDIKWTGLFGSLSDVIRQAAECNLNIDDVKFLAKIYFHLGIIQNI